MFIYQQKPFEEFIENLFKHRIYWSNILKECHQSTTLVILITQSQSQIYNISLQKWWLFQNSSFYKIYLENATYWSNILKECSSINKNSCYPNL